MSEDCLFCNGTGRGTFGGNCSACQGAGVMGDVLSIASGIAILAVVAFIVWVVLF